ncbi:MAG: sensor histidine kinase [Bacteriovoracaceae bacterium]
MVSLLKDGYEIGSTPNNLKQIIRSSDPEGFLKPVSKIPLFKNFDSLIIAYLPKGSTKAKLLSYNSAEKFQEQDLPNDIFLDLFKNIKKSKNKQFKVDRPLSSYIGSLGSYFAKEYTFSDLSYIFIFSRNEFLSPSPQEYENFYSILDALKHKFHYVLTRKEDLNVQEISKSIESIIKSSTQDISNSGLVHHFQRERLKLLSELLDTLKHELSNPIFGVKLAYENLLEVKEGDSLKIKSEAVKNLERCQKIIENFSTIFDDTNIEEDFSLEETFQEVLTLSKSATTGISQTLNIQEELKELKIRKNKTFFIQILFNAIVNSAQSISTAGNYSNSEIQIFVKKLNQKLLIEVIDNGPGLEAEDGQKVFDPFFTTKEKGTGLGLSICRLLAEKLDGTVSLQNRMDETNGAVFTLAIPL